jgi:hypothetical protein
VPLGHPRGSTRIHNTTQAAQRVLIVEERIQLPQDMIIQHALTEPG